MNSLCILLLSSSSESITTTVVMILILLAVLFIYSRTKQKQFNTKLSQEQAGMKPGQKVLRTNGQMGTMIEQDNNCLIVDVDGGERLSIPQAECFSIKSIIDGIKTKLTTRESSTTHTMIIKFAGKEIALNNTSPLFYLFSWKFNTHKIYTGVSLIFIASILSILFSVFEFFGTIQSGGSSLFQTDLNDIFSDIAIAIAYILGFYFILKGLADFGATQQDAENKLSIMKIRNGMICYLISCFAGYIPAVGGVIAGILGVVATIMMLIGFRSLKNSTTYSTNAQQAFATLYTSVIWLMIGSLLEIIPAIGTLLGAIPTIVGYALFIIGWRNLRDSSTEFGC